MFDRNILTHLKQWQNKNNRKPLILRGARQVGKTSIVKLFAEQNFANFVYINLDNSEHYEMFKNVNSIEEFAQITAVVLKTKIEAGKTLLFIDEIQNLPNLIKLLRFFYEELPDLHVIAAGSLLEVKISQQDFSMPVGRVEYAYLYPLTFFEFLQAKQEQNLLSFLEQIELSRPIPNAIHQQALKSFFDYTLIGGMPEAVDLYIQSKSQKEINILYSALLTGYVEDIYKYTKLAKVDYIRHVLEKAPYFAGERITYEKFGESQYKSREMGQAFEVLEKVMLVNQIPATNSCQLPLIAKTKKAKKLLYLDSGLVNFKNNIQSVYMKLTDLNNLYRGKIAEQVVGQNLIPYFMYSPQPIFYWAKDKSSGSAEVDFCLNFKGCVLGIEVKSGHSNKMKSLFSFAESVENYRLIRIYSGQLAQEQIVIAGKKYSLLSLPFYLVNRLFELIGV